MHILARLGANNKFQIRQYRLADGYGKPPSIGDSAEQLENVERCKNLDCPDKLHKLSYQDSEIIQVANDLKYGKKLNLFGEEGYGFQIKESIVADACTLPVKIREPLEFVGQKARGYYEVRQARQRALDILQKSQQGRSKPRVWGKPTKLKEFRYQAGEKIKEGGAIIDRFIGKDRCTMVTMTLPGDTWYAFDALARWSGWIVNRLTQIIRRLKKNEPEIMWFFVWEHQKRGALHMHWCLGWKVSREKREQLGKLLVDKWFDLLFEIGNHEKIDMFAGRGFAKSHRNNPERWQSDITQIDKSVAAYFAKYCQKNASLSEPATASSPKRFESASKGTRKRLTSAHRTCPSRYWGSSQTVKKWSKHLSRERKIITNSDEETNRVLANIRELLPVGQDYQTVSISDFEVIEPVTGACICSGTTETYTLRPDLYPNFHSHVCKEIIDRPHRMCAMDYQFLASAYDSDNCEYWYYEYILKRGLFNGINRYA